jgi:putative sterol carrier protein
VTFTLPFADAKAVLAGELGASVAFMRGRLKTAGDNGLVIGVLGACEGAPLAAWLDAVHGSAS